MEDTKQVIVRIGEQFFGIDISDVVEIKEKCYITTLPSAESNVLGLMNLREEFIPIYSFRRKIGLEEDLEDTNKVVIVDIRDTNVGIKIDDVKEISNIEAKDLFDLPLIAKSEQTSYVSKVGKVGNDLVLLLDLKRIISRDEINAMDELVSKYN